MAQPYPPTGNQQAYTERPLRVYGEQYTAAGSVPIGVSVEPFPPVYPNGEPRVYTPSGTYAIHDGDWVITNRYTGRPIEVISNEEFTERFGGGGPPTITGETT